MALTLRRLAILPLVAFATSTVAQDSEDWAFATDARAKVTVAGLATTAGVTVAVRCVDGGLEAIMTGLPAIDAEERRIGVGIGDEPIHDETWNVAINNTVAVSQLPAPFARRLRNGGALNLRFAGGGEGGRDLRYIIDLPPSPAAIDRTLAACDRPLVDPRDAELAAIGDGGLPVNLNWERRPRPRYPSDMRYAKGFAVVTCMASSDGAVRDCVVETEHPRDGGFGRATLDGTRNARLVNTLDPGAPISPARVAFRAVYYIAGYEPRVPRTGTRIQRPEDTKAE